MLTDLQTIIKKHKNFVVDFAIIKYSAYYIT